MTAATENEMRTRSAVSADGTAIAYHSLGSGPGLIVVGGVLSDGRTYLPLAAALTGHHEVHVVERRGRPGSGPQAPGHNLDDECADLAAVAHATGARVVFGHSFGGLVGLETARRRPIFDDLVVYEPGVPLRGSLAASWLDGYQRLLQEGDRRGAFAWMVKNAGFAPRPIRVLPLPLVRLALRSAFRGDRWKRLDRLLDANLVEHRIQAAVDAPDARRFSSIAARTALVGGSRSPDAISADLVRELADVIPSASVTILPGLGHAAPEEEPHRIAATILAVLEGGGDRPRS